MFRTGTPIFLAIKVSFYRVAHKEIKKQTLSYRALVVSLPEIDCNQEPSKVTKTLVCLSFLLMVSFGGQI